MSQCNVMAFALYAGDPRFDYWSEHLQIWCFVIFMSSSRQIPPCLHFHFMFEAHANVQICGTYLKEWH